ncbi:MAG: AAA family ATPase, partial [Alistipes sp.]|nr:AAA family ATPase [Alistipes sp.]
DLAMFRVNRERADELGLTEDEIEAINEILADESITIDDLETILADAIYEDTSLARTLSLALTNDNLSLLHTAAELNNLQNAEYGEVMNALLGGKLENNSVCNIIADELIHITPIDDSQRAAIATALNSKLSVITGPPGTGKTQMIINLLSNALLRGKSVLVASKVNKAVDNVKDRFDALDPYHYMLRFGSRAVINGQLIPAVESIRAQIPERDYNIQHLSAILTEYQLVCQRAIEARGKLNELQALTKEIEELEHRIQELANNRNIRENTYNEALKTHRQNNADIAKIAENDTHNWEGRHVEVRTTLNLLYSKSKGLRRIIFNLFSKAKYSVKILYDALTLPDEIREKIEQESGIDSVARINSIDDLIRFTECEERHLSRIIAYRKRLKEIHSEHNNAIAEIDKAIKEANERLGWVRRRVAELQSQSEVLNTRIANAREQISGMSMELLRQRIKSRINAPNAISAIARYRGYIPENIPKRGPQIAQFIRDARDFINVFGLNCVTSLSVRNGYPLERELFDMVIIDEASQCDIASALPLIYRAKQVVVVGDPLQLEHITNVRREDEARIKEHLNINDAALVRNINWSLWDHCNAIISTAEENNKSIMLYHHYRCHPRIIGYSNEMFYNRRLGRPLDIHTTEDNGKPYPTGINWIDIEGVQDRYRNINEAEIVKALDIAIRIGRANPDVSIGIISPFRDQAEAIHSRIPEKLKGQIVADTVYRFQGDERDIIIYSTVVTNNSPESKIRWIDIACPNLVNVAVTRAKSSLFIVGNRRYIDEHSNHNRPLGYLSEYTQQNEQH